MAALLVAALPISKSVAPLVAALLVAAVPISKSVAPLVAALLVAAVPISESVALLVAKFGPPNRFQNSRNSKLISCA